LSDLPFDELRVLVSGSAGFIGSQLVPRIVGDGAQVLAVDRSPHRTVHVSPSTNLSFAEVDLSDRNAVFDCVKSFRPNTIVHLACAPDAAENSLQLSKSVDFNLRLTVNLLEAFQEYGSGLFVFGDSSKVYGNSTVPYHSELLSDPISSYAIGKSAAWHYCRFFERLHGMKVVSVRPTIIYGPEQAFNIVTYAVQSVLRSEPIIKLAGGQQTRDPLFIDDAVEAFRIVVKKGRCLSGKVINIGGGFEISVYDLVKRIVQIMKGESRVVADATGIRSTEILRSYCDNAEASAWLGWQPAVDLNEGLRRTIEYYYSSHEK
jgi:UDP-glucuronate 4-epimerase